MSFFSTFTGWYGLLAIVGAVVFAMLSLLASRGLDPGDLLPLLLGMLAAIAGLHTLQRERYRLWGALSSLTSFVGVTLLLASGLLNLITGQRYTSMAEISLLIIGAWVAGLGLVTLGVVTIWARVLPWWCGVLIILGSPPAVLFFMAFVGSAENPLLALGLGIAWSLVGFALFRQARIWQTQQTSHLR